VDGFAGGVRRAIVAVEKMTPPGKVEEETATRFRSGNEVPAFRRKRPPAGASANNKRYLFMTVSFDIVRCCR
jgi:hypothetical protein